MFKQYEWRIIIRVVLMFVTISIASYLLVQQLFLGEVILVPIILYQVIDFFKFQRKPRMK